METVLFCESPVGRLGLAEQNGALCRLTFGGTWFSDGWAEGRTPLLEQAAAQLAEYFAGGRESFDLPLAPQGSEFEQAVWQALCEIPYGTLATYGDIARGLGKPGASRAVGGACNRNPIAIVVPCHRVVGANGRLTGFAGGLETKEKLLRLEGALL